LKAWKRTETPSAGRRCSENRQKKTGEGESVDAEGNREALKREGFSCVGGQGHVLITRATSEPKLAGPVWERGRTGMQQPWADEEGKQVEGAASERALQTASQ